MGNVISYHGEVHLIHGIDRNHPLLTLLSVEDHEWIETELDGVKYRVETPMHKLEYGEFHPHYSVILVNHKDNPFFKELQPFPQDKLDYLGERLAVCQCGTQFYHEHWDHCASCQGTSIKNRRDSMWYMSPFWDLSDKRLPGQLSC